MKAANPSILLEGKNASAMVELYFEFCHLKQIYRQGWLERGIPESRCESVAEHCFGTALLALFVADQHFPELDPSKVLGMALLHDFGEIHAGDITPARGLSRAEKVRRERRSVQKTLASLPGGKRYQKLWDEYEAGFSPEARFVHQIEKLEMALQAGVYEHQGLGDLSDFYASAGAMLEDPQLKEVLESLKHLR